MGQALSEKNYESDFFSLICGASFRDQASSVNLTGESLPGQCTIIGLRGLFSSGTADLLEASARYVHIPTHGLDAVKFEKYTRSNGPIMIYHSILA